MKTIRLKSVDSTNNYAKRISNTETSDVLIIADEQLAGRGQYDRSWFSEVGKSITMSYLLKSKKITSLRINEELPRIISDAINEYCDIKTEVVEPNDIYLNDKKICGLLIEANYIGDKMDNIIVGIGINVSNNAFPDEISERASSIYLETWKKIPNKEIIGAITHAIEGRLK